jgi:hypothetical protein
VQQCQDSDQRLVGVDAPLGAPAAEQAPLFGDADGLTGEASPGLAGQVPGGINEKHLVLASPAEELPGCLVPAAPVRWMFPQEHLYIADIDGGPVVLGPLGGHEAGQVTHDAKRLFDGVVGARTGSCPSSSFTGSDQVIGERCDRGPKRRRGGVDSTLPAPVGEAGFLVETEGQALAHKELLEGPS